VPYSTAVVVGARIEFQNGFILCTFLQDVRRSLMDCMHVSLESGVPPYEAFVPSQGALATSGRAKQRPHKQGIGSLGEMEHCTFRPAIRPSSQARSPRSCESLSRGDYLKRQHSVERARQQQEELHKAAHTFKPVLHTPPRSFAGTQGRLMSKEPSFTSRINNMRQEREFKSQLAKWEREEKEMQECTFHPVTGRMPRSLMWLMSG
jgi:hypothetical protein